MRLDGLDHPKTNELAARLGVSKPTAIGHLELLWAFVAKLAPQGNVGKYPDGAIARAAEWQGDPTAFVDALLLTRLVDECGAHRLIVHDWDEHCPSWVRAKLKKTRLDLIAEPAPPTASPTRVATIEGVESHLRGDYARARVPSVGKGREACNRPPTGMPTIDADRDRTGTAPVRSPPEFEFVGKVPATRLEPGDALALLDTLKATMPSRPGRGHNWIFGERAWQQRLDEGATPADLIAAAQRYRAYVDNGGVSSDAFVMSVDQFFGAVDSPWRQEWQLPTQMRSGSGRKTFDDYKRDAPKLSGDIDL